MEKLRHNKYAIALAGGQLALVLAASMAAESRPLQPSGDVCTAHLCGSTALRSLLLDPFKHHHAHKRKAHVEHHEKAVRQEASTVVTSLPSPTPASIPLPRATQTPSRLKHLAGTRAAIPTVGGLRPFESQGKIVDVSFPQCQPHHKQEVKSRMPVAPNYVVVGLNNGHPGSRDTCLPGLLSWASRAERVDLYVNTDYNGRSNPKAYGRKMARLDLEEYLWPAMKEADWRIKPTDYRMVWLDVETANHWKGTPRQNELALEGMAEYFQENGLKVGVYSVNSPGSYSMFHHVAGDIPQGSSLYGLPSWLGQGYGYEGATQACNYEPLSQASKVVMTQYVQDGFDYDIRCTS